MSKNVRVVVKRPGEASTLESIDSGYKALQGIVGGIITSAGFPSLYDRGIGAYANDEGLLIGMAPNVRGPYGNWIVGPIVFTAFDDEGDTVNLNTLQITAVRNFLEEQQSGQRLASGLEALL